MTIRIKWIVQRNLIKPETLTAFRNAFSELDIAFEEVTVIPFSPDLPVFDAFDVNVFYGSTTLMLNAYASEQFRSGVFYDPYRFTAANYLLKWKNRMLNSDGIVLHFHDFIADLVDSKPGWFIRPDSDTKSFAGTTMTSDKIKDWYSRIQDADDSAVNRDTLLFVSSEKVITREWRNFIVDGKVVDSSRYMLNGVLNISHADVPVDMIAFVEQCTMDYSPHEVFVMDVAEVDGVLRIVECNCFNGTGFYAHDIKRIVQAVTEYVERA
jgi:hypothetical protein